MFSIRVLLVLVLISSAFGFNTARRAKKHKDVGIIGGHNITIEKAPYMVSLRLINGTEHTCGGSIIHEQFILSAGHCIKPDEEYKVLVGTDKVNDGGKLYDVEQIFVHQNFSLITFDYDISILKLNESLAFGPEIDKVALVGNIDNLKKGTMLNATGWGRTEEFNSKISDSLQQVTVPVVSRQKCKRIYGEHITDRMFCAGETDKDTCAGDSGGPLTLDNVQVGVTSHGLGCGHVAGIYTRISVMQKWIKDIIDKNL